MAILNMIRTGYDNASANGAVFHTKIELTSGESDVYLVPLNRMYAIGATQDAGVVLNFSIDSEDTIRNDSANVIWVAWDGLSGINLAITAFKATWSAGTPVATVTIKTELQ